MSIIDKFKKKHPGCVVQNVEVTTAGGFSMSCDVMVVPRKYWTLDEEASDGELVVSVAPLYAFEGDWPLVALDVYVHVDKMQGFYANLSSDIPYAPYASSNVPENVVPKKVVPMACVHVGQASLSAAEGKQKTNSHGDQILYCQYNLNLGFEEEVSKSEAACLKLQFQVHKNARRIPLTRTHSGSRTMGLTGASLADNIEALKAFI
jgi:hypothetical protein